MSQIQDDITSEDRIQTEIDKLDNANKKQEQSIRNLVSRAIQNLNLYFIFQAVILASTTTSAATCRHWWVPFVLSLLAAATNLLGFLDALSKVMKLGQELDQSLLDLAFMKVYPITRDQLRRVLPGSPLTHQGREIVRPKVRNWKLWSVIFLAVGLFVGFSGVVMYGCRRILCHPGERKCVKLC
ncbi:hypothetical protein CASFOL_002423 [Castilleja foliolosa]|uniref:Uncharacterized protein n=1 Tax=Castilleja foliolosa TaxID=1961234 RepID=A0ABD3EEH1_9LAMI